MGKQLFRKYYILKSKLIKRKKACVLVASALLPMTIILIVWAFIGIYPFGSKSLMAVDFSQQYISFYGYLKETVLSGDWSGFFYSFTKSLGGEMIGILAYYLLSPFNLIYIVTPLNQFHSAVFLTIWLRYGAIGMSFAYLLIKRYKALDFQSWLVPIFATTYALSGMLVSYQMNPIFYDAMIMLPLVIITLEELLDGGKPFRYLFTLALTMFLQFYMGYMICLFVSLYACYYVTPQLAIKGNLQQKVWVYLKPLLRALGYSLLGIALVAILLYPVVLNLLQSKGQLSGGMTFSFSLQINPLDILSKLTIGGFDTTSGWSKGPNLPNLFIGAVSFVGFFLYFKTAAVHRYRKIGAGIISFIFFVSFINEFVSKIWHMGQNPAGFFFRFSWIFSFFMIVLAYQALKENPRLSWKGLGVGLVLLGLAGTYVSNHDYTYISPKQPKVLTHFVKDHQSLVYLSTAILFGTVAVYVWKCHAQSKKTRVALVGMLILAIPLSNFFLVKGYLFSQVSLTIIAYGITLLVFFFRPFRSGRQLLIFISVLELGYNAYLSQVTMSYADAYKFRDAITSVKRVTDSVQENSDSVFYRIGSSFAYSKTIPTLLSYPGLSGFSSSLERSTIDLFSYLGDLGVNAATQYANGTALTDTLYGVRYYMDLNNLATTSEDEKKMNFTRFSKRADIPEYYTKTVYNDRRYIVYENPNVFSLAFGTNELVQNINFGYNNPVANQNFILNTMTGNAENKVDYFQTYNFSAVEIENMEEKTNEEGQIIYNRIDKNKVGIIRYKVVPKSSYTYYFLTPHLLTKTQGKVSILLNGQWFTNQQTYAQRQLWQLTSNTEGQETILEFRFSTDNVNMTGAGLVRSDNSAIATVLKERQKQNVDVATWTNTEVKGTVNITDNSTVMMTTIPYSEGWTVKVDGKTVQTKKAWDSLLSFPITEGKHTIEMIFIPKGLLAGLIITLMDGSFISYLIWCNNKGRYPWKLRKSE